MVHTLIVGAGTSGCVLAARLSEDPSHTVRVVEAGSVWTAVDLFPEELRDGTGLPLVADAPWLRSYPVEFTADRSGNIVRGAVVGGSGSINGCYFIRATAEDFAAWSSEVDSSAWDFPTVLPYYRALEHDHDFADLPGHGRGGPVPVRRISRTAKLTEDFASACETLGFPEVTDWNAVPGGPDSGVGPVPCNIGPADADGRRERIGTARSYLLPALSRPNLTLTGNTIVTRLRFRADRVTGVDCVSEGRERTLWADRVVLCAGAIETAALLLRSGIGPPDHLRALGIPVVCPSPVGAWCVDHPEIGITYRHPAALGRTVPLESILAFADIEIRPYTIVFAPRVRQLGIALMRPHGSGSLRLRSADPLVPPIIEYRYLTEESDRSRLGDASILALDLLRRMGARPVDSADPQWDGTVPDAVPGEWLTRSLGTSQHLSGTCRMGSAGDPRAVVDDRGAVHGISGLSVADLSVVPVALSRGPQATTVLLAERLAEYLR
ncbi:mycofactocin dehydrogenase MftG [Nocardia paucivorans]|uniref:mycofactocin dehydrogenase MftG n=1 Tax=Nocardia paucivorans TaxID=114259 RepID=UPI0002F73844|nr:mycofactocin system GMC family oxidoreductase MftG [Nocardia paucivorans]